MKAVLKHPFVTSLLGWIIWSYMALCGRTIRWQVIGEKDARQAWSDHAGLVVAAWHSTIMLLPSGWNRFIRRWPNQRARTAMLISLSRDGEPVAKAISHMKLEAIRGSSTHKKKAKKKGGLEALREAQSLLRSGGVLCITPDGPRGPAETAQKGAAVIAQRTGAPILPYAILSAPEKRLDTWDRFRIPFPFTRGAIVFGSLIERKDGEDADSFRQRLEIELNRATRAAEELLKKKAAP